MIPELESLKQYIELLQNSCNPNDSESIIWYHKFMVIIDEYHAMLINEKLKQTQDANLTRPV